MVTIGSLNGDSMRCNRGNTL